MSVAPSLLQFTFWVMLWSPLSGSKVITSIPFRVVAPLKSPSKTVPSLFVIVPVNVPPLMVPLLSFMTSFLNVPFRMVPVLVTLPWNSVLPAAPALPVIVPLPYSLVSFVIVPAISPPSAFRMPTFVTSVLIFALLLIVRVVS